MLPKREGEGEKWGLRGRRGRSKERRIQKSRRKIESRLVLNKSTLTEKTEEDAYPETYSKTESPHIGTGKIYITKQQQKPVLSKATLFKCNLH